MAARAITVVLWAASGLLVVAPAAQAALPPLGTYRGANAKGAAVSFAVTKVGRQRAVTSIVLACNNLGRPLIASTPGITDVVFRPKRGEQVGGPNAHAAFPIRRSGNLDLRTRWFRPTRGVFLEVPQPKAPPVSIRFSGSRATVTFLRRLREGAPWYSSSQCRENGADADPNKGTIEVSRIRSTVARPGVWTFYGLLPLGQLAGSAGARFYVQPSGFVGSVRGYFMGPSSPPPDRRPNPIWSSWPLPCFKDNVFPKLTTDGSMRYFWGTDAMIEAGPIEPGGSFTSVGEGTPFNGSWVQTSGRFTKNGYSGSYRITEKPGYPNPSPCVNIDIPLRATRDRGAAPIAIGSLRKDGADRIPLAAGVLPVPAEPVDYAALGDSYSSGEGVPPFEAGTDLPVNRCHRSPRAYARLLELPAYTFAKTFLACSGAVTENVTVSAQNAGERVPQLGRRTPEQWGATDMITLTIGGNDAGFARILRRCVFRRCGRGTILAASRRIGRQVRPKLGQTYAAVRRAAPNATVIALGYPQLFPDRPQRRCGLSGRPISRSRQVLLRRLGKQLNRSIAAEAASAGVHFAGVEETFDGHEPCGRRKQWILGLTRPIVYSFHPNALGQRAYASRIRRYLSCLVGRGWPFRDNGMPEPPSAALRPPRGCRE